VTRRLSYEDNRENPGRSARGSGWISDALLLVVFRRGIGEPGGHVNDLGFRLVRNTKEKR
jgi:hypothetical protein